jgi:hypothetical protein
VLLFLLLLVFLVDLLLEYAYVDFTDILGLNTGLSTISFAATTKIIALLVKFLYSETILNTYYILKDFNLI